MSLTGTFTGIGIAPSLVSASFSNGFLKLIFSEPMDSSTIINISNYSIPGVTVIRAEVDPNSQSIALLSITGYSPSTSYTVTCTGLKDKAGNTIT